MRANLGDAAFLGRGTSRVVSVEVEGWSCMDRKLRRRTVNDVGGERRLSHGHTAPPFVASLIPRSCLQHVGLSEEKV